MNIKLNYKGSTLRINYCYQPLEKAETGIEARDPGNPESVEVITIHLGEENITMLLEDQWEDIAKLILKEIHTDHRY